MDIKETVKTLFANLAVLVLKLVDKKEYALMILKENSKEEAKNYDFSTVSYSSNPQLHVENALLEENIRILSETVKQARLQEKRLSEELNKPVKEREQKVAFVNNLNLRTHSSDAILLAGPKGTGKSTFLWLLNQGPKPTKSFTDGTTEIINSNGYLDSIGLRAWTPEEVLKLLVLMIYEGIPQDLIIFCNDRLDATIGALGLVGIQQPMIVILASDFWRHYNRNNTSLPEVGDGASKPEPDLELVYDFALYDRIKKLGYGQPVIHHDDIKNLVEQRKQTGISPFELLSKTIGEKLEVHMENDDFLEIIFRFVYIFEQKYSRKKLDFMNRASLKDFF